MKERTDGAWWRRREGDGSIGDAGKKRGKALVVACCVLVHIIIVVVVLHPGASGISRNDQSFVCLSVKGSERFWSELICSEILTRTCITFECFAPTTVPPLP